MAAVVIEDDPDAVVLFQPAGAPRKHRTGRRGGPGGRNMLPGGWDGGYRDSAFPGPSSVRLHPVGARYSVIRTWDDAAQEFRGWYVNLEQPWVRTPIGFDGRDDILDIRVADDLSGWEWKDADELDWSVDVGKVTPEYAKAVRQAGEDAAAQVAAGVWPFVGSAWDRYRPPSGWPLPTIPEGWTTTSWP